MSPAPYFLGHLRHHPGGTLLCVLAIALGVALGVAVEAIHRSALEDFARGMRSISGQPDLEIRGGRVGFDEALYAAIARVPGVALASPLIELEAKLAGRSESLRIAGIDPFQAVRLAAAVAPNAAPEDRYALLDPDALLLSRAAADWLGLDKGERLVLQSGLARRTFRVAGVLDALPAGQRVAILDIATAQWRFDRLGTITGIGVRFAARADAAAVEAALRALLPAGVEAARPQLVEARQAALSRAYRVNLNMLAMIALVTGALLVVCVQALAMSRRRSELAFLRAAGMTRRQVTAWLCGEGVAIGLAGSVLGVALGHAVAGAALAFFGGDLGAGFFSGGRPPLVPDAVSAAGFLALGTAAATLGAALPARAALAGSSARALKAGEVESARVQPPRAWPGAAMLAAGAGLAFAPPVGGLPVFGYAAILLMLLAALGLLARLAHHLFRVLPEGSRAESMLAAAQLRAAPGQARLAAAGILASVALAVAMAIMVASFRDSVDRWLDRVLPADLYVRGSGPAQTGHLDEAAQAALARVPGMARIEFVRHAGVLLAPGRPEVTLIARRDPGAVLPVIERAASLPEGVPALWVSEAMADLYGWRPGGEVSLPLGGRSVRFAVAGLWRDYARSHGTVALDLALYRRLTGDRRASVAEFWLEPGVEPAAFEARLRAALPGAEALEISPSGAVRARSLAIFDRTFAVTYGMEAAAVMIALAGVGASFASLATLRRREFGMLRHIGMTRGQIASMLAREGLAVSVLGVGAGLAAGALISVVLVHVVNRQSFHWGMDMTVPFGSVALFALSIVLLAAGAAVLAGRRAMQPDAVRAVREDW